MQQNVTLSPAVKKLLVNPAHSSKTHCCMASHCNDEKNSGEQFLPACTACNQKKGFNKLSSMLYNLYARLTGNTTAQVPPACPYKTGDDCSLYYWWT